MDYLRQGIHLRGYAQKNPKQEYKREAFEMFKNLWRTVQHNATAMLVSVEIRQDEDVVAESEPSAPVNTQAVHHQAPNISEMAGDDEALALSGFDTDEKNSPFSPSALASAGKVVHRNDPCPCGSGKKYKQCHGRLI